MARLIAASQNDSIRHEAIPVSSKPSLFIYLGSEEVLETISMMMCQSEYQPPGLVLEEEWDDQGIIREGIRGKKESFVGLPANIWKPRALQWAQSLVAIERVLAQESVL